MASIIKVDRILDSTEIGKVDIPGGIETDVLNATELIADTWKNVDGTENYKCRAWVNFDGTTTPPTIRASGNVSSVVRNATGNFIINFETPIEDSNYAVVGCNNRISGTTNSVIQAITYNPGDVIVISQESNGTKSNYSINSVAIFR